MHYSQVFLLVCLTINCFFYSSFAELPIEECEKFRIQSGFNARCFCLEFSGPPCGGVSTVTIQNCGTSGTSRQEFLLLNDGGSYWKIVHARKKTIVLYENSYNRLSTKEDDNALDTRWEILETTTGDMNDNDRMYKIQNRQTYRYLDVNSIDQKDAPVKTVSTVPSTDSGRWSFVRVV